LLNSSEEILGYGETHVEYVGRPSLVKPHDHVRDEFEKHGESPRASPRYITGKILWPHIHDDTLLRRAPLKTIVIVRAPEDALPSILSLEMAKIQTPREALQYYSNSLTRTSQHLAAYDAPFALARYRDLTEQTEATLQELSEYLELGAPLTPTYNPMWSTGKRGAGAPSERIDEETVVSRRTDYEVGIGDEILSTVRERYQQFLSACDARAHCVRPAVQE
jgi:hypothetical protein